MAPNIHAETVHYACFVRVRHADFVFVEGGEHVAHYRSSEWASRTFCAICGSPLQFVCDEADTFGLSLAALDTRIEALAERQYHTESRAQWMV
jgi:hypothetical protein